MNSSSKREQDFLTAVLDNAGALVVVLDHEGHICRFNRACEKLSGYSLADVDGKRPWDILLPPEDAESIRKHAFEALSQNPGVNTGEYTNYWVSKAGKRSLIAWSNTLLFDEEGKMEFMVSVGNDITRQHRTEEALRKSEQRLREAEQLAQTGAWEVDLLTNEVWWSDEQYRINGITKNDEPLSQQDFLNLVHPDDREFFNAAFDALFANGKFEGDFRIVRPDGEMRHIHGLAKASYDDIGRPIRISGTNQDITERKRYEAQISASNQVLSAVLDTTPVLIAYLDSDMNFVHVNAAYAAADQQEPEYFAGKNHFAMFPNAENEAIFRRVVTTGEPYTAHAKPFEYENNPERGITHWDWTLTPIKDGNTITGLVLSLLNVTDRIEAIEATQRSEQQLKKANESLEARVEKRTLELARAKEKSEQIGETLRTVLDTAPFRIFWKDLDFNFLGCNRLFAADAGMQAPEDLVGKSDFDMAWSASAELYRRDDETIIASGQPKLHFEEPMDFPDGSRIWLSTSKMPLRDSAGNIAGVLGTYDNITDRKKAEAELILAKEEAERANKAKNGFLSRMSHELRTPMNAILGFAQVLELEPIGEKPLEFAKEIQTAGEHLLQLINELLDLSRIEAGKIHIAVQPLNLEKVMGDALQITQPLMTEKHISLHNNCRAQRVVVADPTRLKQILLNLLSNAAKYNRMEGHIQIDCHSPVEGRLRLSVSDTGPGIPSDKLTLLFKPFERLGAEFSAVDGTGIGLALSKELAALMDGELGVESTPGQGSTFWLELPLAQTMQEFEHLEITPQNDSISHHTVLYVEDNAANLRVVEAIFRRHPHLRLLSATNGEQGIELAQRYQPDVILLDIHLPSMSGYAVLTALQTNPRTRNIPVIALSADAMPLDIETGLKAGFVSYLTKPLEIGKLIVMIDQCLRTHEPS